MPGVGAAAVSPPTASTKPSHRSMCADSSLAWLRSSAAIAMGSIDEPRAVKRLRVQLSAIEDLKTLPRERWHLTKARDVMRPIAPRFFVEPNAKLDYARELMKRNGIGSLAVVGKNGELVGFLQSGRFKRKKRSKSATS